jgi:uncharacterized membrane protein
LFVTCRVVADVWAEIYNFFFEQQMKYIYINTHQNIRHVL